MGTPADTLRISELFYSIQGEGSLLGVPSIFIRTSGCNLRCVWCDTPYTSWAPEGGQMTIQQILEKIDRFPAAHVVVTGGEPMIAPHLAQLTDALRQKRLHITIETAGTIFARVSCDLMSISPKLSNSTPWERDGGRWARKHDRYRFQPDVLRRLVNSYEYQLKFVIQRQDDLLEVEQTMEAAGAERSRVILMPEGTDSATIRDRGQWLAEVCKANGFRFSPRLHVDLWGNQRGV